MDFLTIIFSILILVVSVMFHELAHGTVADRLGDPTPRLAGRLTLNPIAHMEWFGSFFLPLLCVITGSGFIIGWAKPVPFNPAHLKAKRWGSALVAMAGPAMNILIALIGAIAFRLLTGTAILPGSLQILSLIVIINLTLAVFNLIPIPPLDGHHILGAIFPKFRTWSDQAMQRFGFIFLIVAFFLAWSLIAPIISFLARIFLGV